MYHPGWTEAMAGCIIQEDRERSSCPYAFKVKSVKATEKTTHFDTLKSTCHVFAQYRELLRSDICIKRPVGVCI